MNIIERYERLTEESRWEEALPVIREIVERSPEIDTSWFNYGVCLEQLGRHKEASDAFIRAHELNIADSGIHYRVFRSLSLAEDYDGLYEFVDYLCEAFPEERDLLFDSEEYGRLRSQEAFREIETRYR